MSGFVGGATKGQYNTNKACPYPPDFCTYVAEFIYEPSVQFAKKNGGKNTVDESTITAVPIGPAVSMHAPPPEHYLTHLPKHPGCKACMNCKVQRKHCRAHAKGQKKKMVEVTQA